MNTRSKLIAAISCFASFLPLSASADHDHETVDPAVEEEALLEARRAYHARQQREKIKFKTTEQGALAGKRIGISPGHGIIWQSNAGQWLFQRSTESYAWGGVREDIHTNQIVIDYVLPMIERAGGEAISMRERTYLEEALVIDNDEMLDGTYVEEGAWQSGSDEGYGGTYRFAPLDPQGTASVRWEFTVPTDGEYPLYVYFLASANRTNQATYTVRHAGGEDVRVLDQSELRVEDWQPPAYPNVPPGSEAARRHNDLWHLLGEFPFRAGETYEVVLTNRGQDPDRVVIADALHVGGGREAAPAPNGSTSGRARWEEGAMPYLRWLGAPDWVFVGDVTARPLYAVYRAVDAYVAIHSNCCNARGTSTWLWYPEMYVPMSRWPANYAANNLPPGTVELGRSVHDAVIARTRQGWGSDWNDQGIFGANFGELRPFQKGWYEDVYTYEADAPLTIPAMLMEIAYHDTEADSRYLREEDYRHDVARGILSGLIRYFNGEGAQIPPLPPAAVHTRIDAATGHLHVRWAEQADPLEPGATAESFRVYTSRDGVLWDNEPVEVDSPEVSLRLDGCEPLYVKVTAVNAAGESLDSPVVGGRLGSSDGARVLYVDGVDREVQTEEDPNNLRSWARVYLPAILEARPAASVEATTDDDVARAIEGADYDLVVWATGQTSTREQSLTAADQSAIEALLGGGAKLVISGAEMTWELVEVRGESDGAFAREVLGADYVADDAETTRIDASALGLGELSFGDCSADAPCMRYPDVLAATEGGDVLATYATEGAAIVASSKGTIVAGFPLEAAAPPDARLSLIGTLVSRSLDEVSPGSGDCPAPEVEPDAGSTGSPDAGRPDAAGPDDVDDDNPDVSSDAGFAGDGGRRIDATTGGCGCGVTPVEERGSLLLVLLALVGARLRRRKSK